MFEEAERGQKIGKEEYDSVVPGLREDLLAVQHELLKSGKFQVIILIGGVDGAGKSETVQILNAWMDPRFIQTNALGPATEEELAHPPMWRFWRALPPKGRIGVFFGSWYTEPIVSRVFRRTKNRHLNQALARIVRFEKMLENEGALILKFWLHLSKEVQKTRLAKLERDPETRWRVGETEWAHFRLYDRFRKISETALGRTSTPEAPWIIVEGEDPRFRYVTIARHILESIQGRLAGKKSLPASRSSCPPLPAKDICPLKNLDQSRTMEEGEFERLLKKYQRRLNLLVRSPGFKRISAILVFEGSDAAGKGGAIRRVTGALDPRSYRIIPIAAPTEEERAHPYLWRFWRHIPRNGNFTIFDRSWYGRVLVERVEGFCPREDWTRAYGEINDFEQQLQERGGIVIKFWLSITKDEQLRRFNEREATRFKNFKITEEDWRNREKWNQYETAVSEMVRRTDTPGAPWIMVEGNNKFYARIKILKEICSRISAAVN